ncbi:MAG: beta/gamma crystallin family protein [Acidobacteriota bacterium]|nr:beta/gamma crystallin family protein [Acidobacteriota bacterium]
MRIQKTLGSIVLLGAIAAFAATSLAGQDRGDRDMGRIGITVFEHPNYGGRNATFRDEVPNLSDYNLNDRVSSFRIARGESWEVCEHKDFGGRCTVFSGDEPDLARVSWNDMITSLRPVRGGARRGGDWGRGDDRRDRDRQSRLVLYDQRNFRGEARELLEPESDVPGNAGRVLSLNVQGGVAWEICSRPNFGGRCVVVSEDVPDLRSMGMEYGIGSARPSRESSDPRRRRYEEPRLILFDRPEFRGRSREVNGTEEEISDFNDRAQSLRAVGRWELCEHKNFRGRCVTVSGDVPDLEALRFRNTLTSARPVEDRR